MAGRSLWLFYKWAFLFLFMVQVNYYIFLYPYVRLEHGAVNDNMAIALIIAFIAVFYYLLLC